MKGPISKVIYKNPRIAILFIQTVSDGSGDRFVDDTQNLKTGDGAGILDRLPLRII
ncbi:hypothetical protein L208DRAFT_1344712 [Tricholoma matsutake]|nr:hypothetical protein L208DRAFT_1344712 [Tricholoma matsutake 945]